MVMDQIGKIIFNSLVTRKHIWLPCVGTFSVETLPARDNGDGTVSPPVNELVFSENRTDAAQSVTDMIEPGPEGETPAGIYDRWLVKATERGPVVIDGIGVVNGGIFTPYESLIQALNPIIVKRSRAVRPAGKSKRLSRNEKTGLALIALFIIVLAVGWTLWNRQYDSPSGHNRWNVSNPAATDDMDRLPEATGAVDEEAVGTEEEVTVTEIEAETVDAPAVVAADAGFYVVGAVFSIPENADKYIVQMKAKYPELEYRKHPYPGNTTMVSLGGYSDRSEANRQRRRIEDIISEYDLWVYEIK